MKTKLKTPYNIDSIPHNYHPCPNFSRDSFICLNGEWDFTVKKLGTTDFIGKITVPFPPESDLSGVGRITSKDDILIYERIFTVDCDKRLLLHFGAVDCHTIVLINDVTVGTNNGGYIPFTFDITDYVNQGGNTIKVIVEDNLNKTHPYGKQKYKRGGMWYTPISGIWQTVWLEYVPDNYIKDIKMTTTLSSVTIKVTGGCAEKIILTENIEYKFMGEEITINIQNPKLWSPENPNIYRFTLLSGEDRISSYFALRTIEICGNNILLNGKPYFFHGLLDQGYFPDGIFMPANETGFKDDILNMKSLGFNTLRKHIKIESQIFYYYCDIYGMIVFQDMVNNGDYNFFYDTALPTMGLKSLPRTEPQKVRNVFYKTAAETVNLLYNHPSVVYYTIFNEGWGQHNTKNAYNILKKLDSTRIWDTASGWFKTRYTDVQSEHIYFKKAKFKIGNKPTILSEFGGYSCNIEGHIFNTEKVYGYKICKTKEELSIALERLYLNEVVPLIKKGLNGAILTQISDVEDETNGLITYDRKIIKPKKETMLKIAKALKNAFYT